MPPLAHRLASGLFFVVALSAPAIATARCLSHPSQGVAQSLSFGPVVVSPDAPAGTVLAERSTAGWQSPRFKCIKPVRTASLGLFGTPSPLGDNIYETNVPGVGIRVYFYNHNYGERAVPDREPISWIFDAQLANAHFRVQLVKTGAVVDGGNLLAGTLARGGYDDQAQAWVDLADTHIEPQRPTCAFASKRLLFTLGKVDGRDLAAAGSSHWATQQLLVTGCTHASQMLMTFSGTADPADPSLFRLTGQGTATGVAVELRSDDPDTQALPNSPTPLVLPARTEGQSFGFRARYRTTGARIEPGAANTSITVNVAYR
ncbi:MAG: fimbrial protein [Luteibacter sp.]